MPQEPRAPTGLQWGQCCDCGAPLWVPTDAPRPDAHCTPCHAVRLFGGDPDEYSHTWREYIQRGDVCPNCGDVSPGKRVHPECAAQAAELEADLAHSNAFARALDGPPRPRYEERAL
jgi:hypothetical protein